MKNSLLSFSLCFLTFLSVYGQRSEQTLEKNWKFMKGDVADAQSATFNDTQWEKVRVPHDWAIYGPFDRNNDLQRVAVTQNLETSFRKNRTYRRAALCGNRLVSDHIQDSPRKAYHLGLRRGYE